MNEHESLPSLGPRGEGWVVLQVILLAMAFFAGILGPDWPQGLRIPLAVLASIAGFAGVLLFVSGLKGLGHNLTPFPKPVARSSVTDTGAYRLVRHPIYGGVILLIAAWALLTSPIALAPGALAAPFLDAKRRHEEAWLRREHPEYEPYATRVTRLFVPFIW